MSERYRDDGPKKRDELVTDSTPDLQGGTKLVRAGYQPRDRADLDACIEEFKAHDADQLPSVSTITPDQVKGLQERYRGVTMSKKDRARYLGAVYSRLLKKEGNGNGDKESLDLTFESLEGLPIDYGELEKATDEFLRDRVTGQDCRQEIGDKTKTIHDALSRLPGQFDRYFDVTGREFRYDKLYSKIMTYLNKGKLGSTYRESVADISILPVERNDLNGAYKINISVSYHSLGPVGGDQNWLKMSIQRRNRWIDRVLKKLFNVNDVDIELRVTPHDRFVKGVTYKTSFESLMQEGAKELSAVEKIARSDRRDFSHQIGILDVLNQIPQFVEQVMEELDGEINDHYQKLRGL
ncbi:hypothetical protein ACFLZX_03130 [Nanoarchaeota archaeon]